VKLWANDIAPKGDFSQYYWCSSVDEAKYIILQYENSNQPFELIEINPDASTYFFKGGGYINLINWLEETERNYPIRICNNDPVVVVNIRQIIKRNNWKEIIGKKFSKTY
jgi:hypothetical protein